MKIYNDISSCLSAQQIERFVKGTMAVSERGRVEQHLLQCEFCKDAVEGAGLFPDQYAQDAIELKRRISKVSSQNNTFIIWSVAAIIALLIGIGFVMYINTREKQEHLSISEVTSQPYKEPEPNKAIDQEPTEKSPAPPQVKTTAKVKSKAEKVPDTGPVSEPLIMKDNTSAGATVTREDIASAPARDVNEGVPSKAESSQETSKPVPARSIGSVATKPSPDQYSPEKEMLAFVPVENQAADRAYSPSASPKSSSKKSVQTNTWEAETKSKVASRSMADSVSGEGPLTLIRKCLQLHQPAEALKNIENLDKQPQYKTMAQWFRAIAYLQQGKNKEASELLHELSNGHSPYSTEAAQLLKKWEEAGFR